MYGFSLGRKAYDPEQAKSEKKVECQNNKRSFSLSKRCYKMGIIEKILEDIVHTAVSFSVLTTNLFKILDEVQPLFTFYWKV